MIRPLIRFALSALLALTGGAVAAAEAPAPGLIENRTGLPLTLPLLVHPPKDRDVHLTLRAIDADAPALTAYVDAGEPLRLLAPPGHYRVEVATGTDWEGLESLFGPSTRRIAPEGPLRFAVTGANRKSGHLLDLTGSSPEVRPYALCQGRTVRRSATGANLARPDDRPPEPAFDTPLPYAGVDPAESGSRKLGIAYDTRAPRDPYRSDLSRPRRAPPSTDRAEFVCD